MKTRLAIAFICLALTTEAQDTIWVNLDKLRLSTRHSYELDTVIYAGKSNLLGEIDGKPIASQQPLAKALHQAHRAEVVTEHAFSLRVESVGIFVDATESGRVAATSRFSFFRILEDDRVEYFNVTKTHLVKLSGKSPDELISLLNTSFSACLDSLDIALEKGTAHVDGDFSHVGIEDITSQYLDYPLLSGYYKTYEDFVSNHNRTDRKLIPTYRNAGSGKPKAIILHDSKGKRVKDVWAYSDGNRVYAKLRGVYYPLVFEKNHIHTEYERVDKVDIESAAIAYATIVGGIAAGLAGCVAIYKITDETSIITYPTIIGGLATGIIGGFIVYQITKDRVYEMSLDATSGLFVETKQWVQRVRKSEVYIYAPKSLKNDSLIIDINDEPMCLLGKDEFFFYETPANKAISTICVTSKTSGKQACADYAAIEGGFTSYFTKVQRDGAPILEKMNPNQYSGIMLRIDKQQIPCACGCN